MKTAFIALLHLVAIAHATSLLQKENQSHLDGVIFVIYVVSITLYWKKIAKQKKKEYEKRP
jgi:membrane protein implicated in regulation of membrane protease activity